MSPIMAALAVGGITTLGRWANNKPLTIDTVVGIVGIGVVLTLIAQVDEPLAKGFGTLAVIAVGMVHLPTIFKKARLTP